jgi:adenine-specific DNA glycosylase
MGFSQITMRIIRLPGIGPYTAAAIASFAFGEPKPVVDGNVFRILARYFGIETDILHASALINFHGVGRRADSGGYYATFNQAIMEFGSLQRSPVPQCASCPLQPSCVAYATDRTQLLPVKSKKKPVRERFLAYFILNTKEKFGCASVPKGYLGRLMGILSRGITGFGAKFRCFVQRPLRRTLVYRVGCLCSGKAPRLIY